MASPVGDVLGRDEAVRRPVPGWLARPSVAVVAGLAVLVLLAGAGAAVVVEEPAAAPGPAAGPAVRLVVVGGGAGPAGGTAEAAGELGLLVVNERDRRLRLGSLSLAAPGLRVVSVDPPFGRPLGPRERREYRVSYAVPICATLQLPASLRVSYEEGRQGLRSERLSLGTGLQPVPFAVCPPGSVRAVRPDLAVRAIGGTSARVGAGVRGSVELEVRNAGDVLRLLSVGAEVPGVRFINRGQPNGLQLGPDDRVEVNLGFEIDDCALLRRTGRLVLRVEQAGGESEIGLTVTTDVEAGTVRQLALDRVLQACAP